MLNFLKLDKQYLEVYFVMLQLSLKKLEEYKKIIREKAEEISKSMGSSK